MQVFVGTFVHSTVDTPMVILKDSVLGVHNSKIKFLEKMEKLDQLREKYGFKNSCITHMTQSQFMMPGMVDTHIHASQFPHNGLKLDQKLSEWLMTYTLPLEQEYSDVKMARDVFTKVVNRLLRNGTTTASYYSSIHLGAVKVLADVAHAKGQRALVGKDNRLLSQEVGSELGVQESLRDTEAFICYVNGIKSPLVQPILTPSWGLACPIDQLKGLGELAKKYNCPMQSHLNEIEGEASLRADNRHPNSHPNILEGFAISGLLGKKTIMAHCIWVDDDELEQMRMNGVGVAHCPNSNLSIRSGFCDVRRYLEKGVKVGLGTDCSAGYSPSLLNAIRCAVHVSNTLSILRPNYQQLSVQECFRLATLGGAQVVSMEDLIGNFEVGKEFDSLLVDTEVPNTPLDVFDEDTAEEKIQRFLFNGDDRNIVRVFVAGRCVFNQDI